MARLLWHDADHHHHHLTVNPALIVGAIWLALAAAVAIYDIGGWINAW